MHVISELTRYLGLINTSAPLSSTLYVGGERWPGRCAANVGNEMNLDVWETHILLEVPFGEDPCEEQQGVGNAQLMSVERKEAK